MWVCLWAGAAHAENSTLEVAVGDSQLVEVAGQVGTVFVADPEIADIQVPSESLVLVLGKRSGTTSLYVLDKQGRRILQRRIQVRHNIDELQSILHQRFPALVLTLESAPGSLLVGGVVPSAEIADAIVRTITPYIGDDQLINRLDIDSPTQVYLQVRVTEVARSVTQRLGVNWQALASPGNFVVGLFSGRDFIGADGRPVGAGNGATSFLGGYSGSDGGVQAMLDILHQEGLVSILAEPNLTAVSGQTASFLAGGEFPVPVRQELNSTSVDFKPFGVALDFTPTVLANDRISIKVRPEISELDPSSGITVDGLSIPGVSVRRVETTVEMASGQSFAIGGLLQNNVRDMVNQVPGLASLPVLGRLFSSSDFQNQQTELVVIVTPLLVRPTSSAQLASPLSSLRGSSDIEYLLKQRIGFDALTDDAAPRLNGAAGFIY